MLGAAAAVGLGAFIILQAMWPNDVASALDGGYYATARDLLASRAEGGDAVAQNTLGNLYYLGLGGSQDQRAAARWYIKSALQNHSDAQVNIARHYRLGIGVPKDPMRGIGWLQMARQNGNRIAEGHMKLALSRLELTPNQIQRAKEQYRTLDALRPKENSQ